MKTITRLRRKLLVWGFRPWKQRFQRCMTCGIAYHRALNNDFSWFINPPCGHPSTFDVSAEQAWNFVFLYRRQRQARESQELACLIALERKKNECSA